MKEIEKPMESFRTLVLEERDKGNIVILTPEGPMVMPLKDIIEQPTDVLLYDLNRNESVILTFIEDRKWVNDFAVAQVIRELKNRLSQYMEFVKWIGESCFKYENDDNGWLIITDNSRDTELGTTEQAYKYWLTNIKK